MIVDTPDFAVLAQGAHDVVIIGGGPLGLNMAIALSDREMRVLVLESGREAPAARAGDLAADEVRTPDTHHAAESTVARRLGGASNLWGGRCVPCDPIDFEARPWLDLPAWPVTKADLDPYLAPAVAAFGAGAPVFRSPVPDLDQTAAGFDTDRLERWSDQPRTQVLHRDRLANDPGITIALGVTVTGIERDPADPGRIAALHLWRDGNGKSDDARARLPARQVILAAGGNAATRLLLNIQAEDRALFGGPDGPLGRCYMGHVNGQIADIIFANTPLHDAMDFHVDDHGSYVRRRLTPTDATQRARELSNVAFWPVVPEIAQAAHRSGPLSAVFLALSTPVLGKRLIAESIRLKHLGPRPWKWGAHLRNLLTDPFTTLGFVPWFLWHRRYAKHRIPGFFLKNRGRRYGLEFHSEHLPNPDSRLTLSDARDASGLRRLRIDFRFSQRDVESVLAAHDALEEWLAASGLGHLEYRYPPEGRAAGVLQEARHGNHQEGTIPMGHNAGEGIVDGWGSSFDLANLHVVSTAILPTSSQANPTLTALQIGLRLADRLKDRLVQEGDHA